MRTMNVSVLNVTRGLLNGLNSIEGRLIAIFVIVLKSSLAGFVSKIHCPCWPSVDHTIALTPDPSYRLLNLFFEALNQARSWKSTSARSASISATICLLH